MLEIRASSSGLKTQEIKGEGCPVVKRVFTASVDEILKEAGASQNMEVNASLREIRASLEAWGIGDVPDSVASMLKDASIQPIFNGNMGIKAKYASVKEDIDSINPEEHVFFRVRAIDACGFEKTAHAVPPNGNCEDLNTGANANADYFSEEQLLAKRMHNGREVHAFETFVGCPFFTNHENTDIEKARGKIINAFYDLKNHCVFCDVRVDKVAYPKLARGIEAGYMVDVSMGSQVDYSICSVCGNKRQGESDCCDHIRHYKGRTYAGKKVYEINYGLKFIECSSVATGACENCKVECVMPRHELSERLIAAASGVRRTLGHVNGLEPAIANIEKSGNILSKANKLGSKEDLDKLFESLQMVKEVGKNILDRNDVDFSFMGELSDAMEKMQDVIVGLDEAGFGSEAPEQDTPGEQPQQSVPGQEPVAPEEPMAPGMAGDNPLDSAPPQPEMGQDPMQQNNSFALAGRKDSNLEKIALRNKLAQNWDKLTQRNSDSMKNLSVEKNGYTLKVAGTTVTAYHKGEKIAENQMADFKPAIQAAFNVDAHDTARMLLAALENAPPVEDVVENQLEGMGGNFKRQGKDTPVTLEAQLDSVGHSPESGFAEFLLNGTIHKTNKRAHERVGDSGLELPVVESQIEDRRGDAKADVIERHLDSGKYNTKREESPFDATLEGVLDNENGAPDVVVENQISARRQGSDAVKGSKLASAVKNVVIACTETARTHGISPEKVVGAFAKHGKSGIVATASAGTRLNEAKIAHDILGRIKDYDANTVSAVAAFASANGKSIVNGVKGIIAKEAAYLQAVAAGEEFAEIEEEVSPEEEIKQALEAILEIAQEAVSGDGEGDVDALVVTGPVDGECGPCEDMNVDSGEETGEVADEPEVETEDKKFAVAKVLLTKEDIGVEPKSPEFGKAVAHAVARVLTASYGKPALPNNVKVEKLRALRHGVIQVDAKVAQPTGAIEKLAGALWVKKVTAQTPPPMGTGFQDQFSQQQSAPQGPPLSSMNQDPAPAPDAGAAPEAEDSSESAAKFCPVCGSDDFEGDGNNKTCGNCGSDLLFQETVVIKNVGDGAEGGEDEGEEVAPAMPPAPGAPAPDAGGFDQQQNQAITQASVRMHPYTLMKTANVIGRSLRRGEAGSIGSHCPSCGDGRTLLAKSCGACAACGTSFKVTAKREGYKVNTTISWREGAFADNLKVLREAYTSQAARLADSSKQIIAVANANAHLNEKGQRNLCAKNLMSAGFAKADALEIANATIVATALEEDDDTQTKLNILDDGASEAPESAPVIGDEEPAGDDSFDGFDVEDGGSEEFDLGNAEGDTIDIDLSFGGNEVSFSVNPETGDVSKNEDEGDMDEPEFMEEPGDEAGDDVPAVAEDDAAVPGDMGADEPGLVKEGEGEESEDDGIGQALARASRIRKSSSNMSKQAREIAEKMGIDPEELKIRAQAYKLGLGNFDKPGNLEIGKSGYDGYFARLGLVEAHGEQTQPLDAFEGSDVEIPRNAEVGAKDLGKLDEATKTPPKFAPMEAEKQTSGNPDGYVQNYIENVKPDPKRFKGAGKKRRK